jgi:radical SAM/Cys-rich protein
MIDAKENLRALEKPKIPRFEKFLQDRKLNVTRTPTQVLQINVGKLCNQACLHCHVEAGPKRTEIMGWETMERLLVLLKQSPEIQTVDLTGGAPEMNPHFREFVREVRRLDKTVIDRCNLTIFFEKGYEAIPSFLKEHQVQVVASLPCYSKANVEKQRGNGVFDKSIEALKLLNDLGYGKKDSGLNLHLVYNPGGAFLPPEQMGLQEDYKRELKSLFDIEFNDLYTITNMPIKRFLRDLERSGKLETYMELLLESFNSKAALGVMCRNTISVGWDGELYDCDFNQMLEIPLGWKKQTIWDVPSLEALEKGKIAFAQHCYGCTAGAGSSCGGSLV